MKSLRSRIRSALGSPVARSIHNQYVSVIITGVLYTLLAAWIVSYYVPPQPAVSSAGPVPTPTPGPAPTPVPEPAPLANPTPIPRDGPISDPQSPVITTPKVEVTAVTRLGESRRFNIQARVLAEGGNPRIPAGLVQFVIDGVPVIEKCPLQGGVATLPRQVLDRGVPHAITATYEPMKGEPFLSSESRPFVYSFQ
jgi:hypothetical protein